MHLVDDFDPQSGFFYGTSTRSLLANGSSIVLPGRGRLAPHRAETILSALGRARSSWEPYPSTIRPRRTWSFPNDINGALRCRGRTKHSNHSR